jgi:3-hydroxyisobutyrate dehydrogenase
VTRIGFVGLGHQGAPMAEQIIGAGFEVTLFARRPDTIQPFVERVVVASDLPELGRRAEIIGVCVANDHQVLEVVDPGAGLLAGTKPGSLLLIHSTISPHTVHAVAQMAKRVGVKVVDAPVSGGPEAPAKRQMVVLVGGNDEDIARCMPVFETYSEDIFHLGGLGSGQMVKLLNNTLLAVHLGAAHDALEAADLMGIDRRLFVEAVSRSSGGSAALEHLFDAGSFAGLLTQGGIVLRKDVSLLQALLESQGFGLPLLLGSALATLSAMEL